MELVQNPAVGAVGVREWSLTTASDRTRPSGGGRRGGTAGPGGCSMKQTVHLKPDSRGWFAAGAGFERALGALSDAAFKVFVHVCLRADGCLEFERAGLSRELGKSRSTPGRCLRELEAKRICEVEAACHSQLRRRRSPHTGPARGTPGSACECGSCRCSRRTWRLPRGCLRGCAAWRAGCRGGPARGRRSGLRPRGQPRLCWGRRALWPLPKVSPSRARDRQSGSRWGNPRRQLAMVEAMRPPSAGCALSSALRRPELDELRRRSLRARLLASKQRSSPGSLRPCRPASMPAAFRPARLACGSRNQQSGLVRRRSLARPTDRNILRSHRFGLTPRGGRLHGRS